MYRLLLLASIAFCSCTYTSPEPKPTGNFPANISAINQANCLGGGCHSGPTSENEGLDLSSWETMIKGGDSFNEVIPFTALKSHFFGHLNTDSTRGPSFTPLMPSDDHPLSKVDQTAYWDWINQGAQSADGKIPYSYVTKKIFIINQTENMFSVLDANTQRVVRIISAGDTSQHYQPAAIAAMPDESGVIVAMLGAKGAIRKYDQASYAMTGECASGLIPNAIAITSDGSKGYITDNSSLKSTKIGIFDPRSMTMTKTLTTPFILQPFSVAVAPDNKYVYVSGYTSDNILRIDTRTDSVVGNLPLGADVTVPVTGDYIRQYLPGKIVISPDSKRMYVTCVNTSEVVVFDLEKDSIIARISLPYSPRAEALSPDGSELWTATWLNTAHVIDTKTNQIIAEVDSISQSPHDMMITPDGKYVYVACEYLEGGHHHHASYVAVAPSSFVVIERATRKVLSIEELPGYSVGITHAYGK